MGRKIVKFNSQISDVRRLKVIVDHMVLKAKTQEHIFDLEKIKAIVDRMNKRQGRG